MMKKVYLTATIIISLLIGCSGEKENNKKRGNGVINSDSMKLREDIFRDRKKLGNINLNENNEYGAFSANNQFISFYEHYFDSLYVYDIVNEEMYYEEKIDKGKGPEEVDQVGDISVSENDILYINDTNNAKILTLDIREKSYSEVNLSEETLRPTKIDSDNGNTVLLEPTGKKGVGIADIDRDVSYKRAKDFNIIDETRQNFFSRVGDVNINEGKYIYYKKYIPEIYVFSTSKNKLIKDIKFAKSDVVWGRDGKRDDGSVVHLPPKKVDVKVENIVGIPNTNRYLIHAKGEGEDRKFGLSTLYEYNMEKEEFMKKHNLGYKVSDIVLNEKRVYLYSEEEAEIYYYKLYK